MAEKNFLSWVGFKGEGADQPAPSENALERIRQLETQLSDMRSRRDITSLTKEEFEILATETAMSIIKTAQAREAKANSAAQKIVSETAREVKEKLESSETKAKAILSAAENRGRKYLQAAESDADELKANAESESNKLLSDASREASSLTSAAKRESQRLIEAAASQIIDYRSWLSTAIAEAERLHRSQNASLNAAEQAIQQTRQKLQHAFDRLAELQMDINANLDAGNNPVGKSFVSGKGKQQAVAAERERIAAAKRAAKKNAATKKSNKKK
jgi:cell division septum initiation protein DivIVA